MLEMKPAHLQTWEVEYEPGDCTRYSFYIIYINWSYHIIANNSTFNFPKIIPDYQIRDFTDEEIVKQAEAYDCNPHTFKAVLDVLKKIREGV